MDKEVKQPKVDWSTWNNILTFKPEYNKKRDILFIHTEEDRTAVSIDCNGEYWVRVDPDTGEILGVEIEDFKRVFLKRHPIMMKATSYVRPVADFIQLDKCTA